MQLHCCGADTYQDWAAIDWYRGDENPADLDVVPASCCATVGGCNSAEIIFVEDITNGTFIVWDEVCLHSCTLYMHMHTKYVID